MEQLFLLRQSTQRFAIYHCFIDHIRYKREDVFSTESFAEDPTPRLPLVLAHVEQAGSASNWPEKAGQKRRPLHGHLRIRMDLVGHVWGDDDEQDTGDRPHVYVITAFMLEMFARNVPKSILIVCVRRELIQGLLEVEEMPEKQRMAWSNRLWRRSVKTHRRLRCRKGVKPTNPSFCFSQMRFRAEYSLVRKYDNKTANKASIAGIHAIRDESMTRRDPLALDSENRSRTYTLR